MELNYLEKIKSGLLEFKYEDLSEESVNLIIDKYKPFLEEYREQFEPSEWVEELYYANKNDVSIEEWKSHLKWLKEISSKNLNEPVEYILDKHVNIYIIKQNEYIRTVNKEIKKISDILEEIFEQVNKNTLYHIMNNYRIKARLIELKDYLEQCENKSVPESLEELHSYYLKSLKSFRSTFYHLNTWIKTKGILLSSKTQLIVDAEKSLVEGIEALFEMEEYLKTHNSDS